MRLTRPLLYLGLTAMLLVNGGAGFASSSLAVDEAFARGGGHFSFHASSPPIARAPSSSFSAPRATTPSAPPIARAPSSAPPIARAPSPDSGSTLGRSNSGSSMPIGRAPSSAASPQSNRGGVLANRSDPVGNAMARGQSANALATFRAEQSKFKQPAVGVPPTPQAARSSPVWRTYGSSWHSADDYYRARSTAMNRLPPTYYHYYSSPPIYVLHSRPSYGPWRGVFLGSLLGVAAGVAIDDAYVRWAYAHRSDPNYQQWHQDMVAQAESDPDLQSRLTALDNGVNTLQQQNAQVDSNQLPPGVDPSLAVSDDTVLMATASNGWSAVDIIGGIVGAILAMMLLYYLFIARSRKLAI